VIQIQEGKYYRTRGGAIVGPAERTHSQYGKSYTFSIDGVDYTADGFQFETRDEVPLNLAEEVAIVPVLGFELKAGCKYETVRPDGSPGPVVELVEHALKHQLHQAYLKQFPFSLFIDCKIYFAMCDGLILSNKNEAEWSGCRIVREQPKPPTAIERLERLRNCSHMSTISSFAKGELNCAAIGLAGELDAIIADLKAEASK
jgi:hypothetical protein